MKSRTLTRSKHRSPSISPGLALKQIKFLTEKAQRLFYIFSLFKNLVIQIAIFSILRLTYSHSCAHVNKHYKHTEYKQRDGILIPSLQMWLLMDLVLPIYPVPVAEWHWCTGFLPHFFCLFLCSFCKWLRKWFDWVHKCFFWTKATFLPWLAGLGWLLRSDQAEKLGREGEVMPIHYLHQGWCSYRPTWANSKHMHIRQTHSIN